MKLADKMNQLLPSATLSLNAKAIELKQQGLDIISLTVGEPDFNTSPNIIEAARLAALNGQTRYTATSGIKELKQAIVMRTKIDHDLDYQLDNVFIGSGAKHVLYTLLATILNPTDEVIIPSPYWVSYPEQVKLLGGEPVILETTEQRSFKITPEQLRQAITSKTKALILCSPSNPTGMVYSVQELLAIAQVCVEHNILIIADEIYDKLVYNDTVAVSIASLSSEIKANTIVINGVSKTYAMTGWRIGYALGNADIIKAMSNYVGHSTGSPQTMSQYAAIEALTGEQETVETMRLAFQERLNLAYDALTKIPGISCIKPQGAFYLFFNAKEAYQQCGYDNVSDFCEALLAEQYVAVVPGPAFGVEDYIRLSYAADQAIILEAINRIKTFVLNKIN